MDRPGHSRNANGRHDRPAGADAAGAPAVSPTAAAERLVETLRSIDLQARRARRTLPTMAEREAALAQVDESEDSINRDLLLKFLGSVSS